MNRERHSKIGRAAAAAVMIGTMIGNPAVAVPTHSISLVRPHDAPIRTVGERAPPCVPTFIYFEDGTYIIVFCAPARPVKLPFN